MEGEEIRTESNLILIEKHDESRDIERKTTGKHPRRSLTKT